MREIQVCPRKRGVFQLVGRLAFDATGNELVAWVGNVLHAFDLRSDSARVLFRDDSLPDSNDFGELFPEIVLSPDCRYAVFDVNLDPDGVDDWVCFADLLGREEHQLILQSDAGVGLVFTPDGKELITVQNHWRNRYEPEVSRLGIAALTAPPKRYREEVNPLTNKTYQVPVRDLKWKRVMELHKGEMVTTVALSANGRLLATGTSEGKIHVADLKKKKVLATFPAAGRKARDRVIVRIGFDPLGQWVVSLANGRLCARPLGAGKSWQTNEALGHANDFAFHPEGRTLCAVFFEGWARFLDPHTGAEQQAFKWGKKSLDSVAFAPDGLTCAAGSENGKVILWDVDA